MDNRIPREENPQMEAKIRLAFPVPEPDPGFVKRLEVQLIAQAEANPARRSSMPRPAARGIRAWSFFQFAGAGVAIVIMILGLVWSLESLQRPMPAAPGTSDQTATALAEGGSAAETPWLTPDSPAPLSMASTSEAIRARLLASHTLWRTLWADAQAIYYTLPAAGESQTTRTQVWIEQPAQARLLSGPLDGNPTTLWISDGERLRNGEAVPPAVREMNFFPPRDISDTIYPHPMSGFLPTPLAELLFPAGRAQRGGGYQPVGVETIAGREALVVEWLAPHGELADRFWIDTHTGVILRNQHIAKDGSGALETDIYLTAIEYDLEFQRSTFDRQAPFPPGYALDAQDVLVSATPAPISVEVEPNGSLEEGEVYLLLSGSGYNTSGLFQLPAACLVTGDPCPPAEIVSGFPADSPPTTLSWSPDGRQLFYPDIFADRLWLYDRLAQTWQVLEAPFFTTPVWSPDGSWLTGVPPIPGDQVGNPLALVNTATGEASTILGDVEGYKTPVGWPDENSIVFLQTVDNTAPGLQAEIQRYDLQSGALDHLTSIFYENRLSGPVLSPDRTRLAYAVSSDNGQSVITLVDLASGELSQVNFDRGVDVQWSPDGQWLTLTAALGFTCEIHLVRPDGSDRRQIFTGDWGGACNSAWDPQSRYLLVPAYAQNPTVPRLYVVSVLDGSSRLVELADTGVPFEWPLASWVR